MITGLALYSNSLETQKKLTKTLWGIVGGVLTVTPKIGILGPGPFFQVLPRAQNTKLGLKNDYRPSSIPKFTRNSKKKLTETL